MEHTVQLRMRLKARSRSQAIEIGRGAAEHLLETFNDDESVMGVEVESAPDDELASAARAVLAVLDSRPPDGEIVCGGLSMAGVLRRALQRRAS